MSDERMIAGLRAKSENYEKRADKLLAGDNPDVKAAKVLLDHASKLETQVSSRLRMKILAGEKGGATVAGNEDMEALLDGK